MIAKGTATSLRQIDGLRCIALNLRAEIEALNSLTRFHHRFAVAEDVKERGIDPLSPVYNLLDLTPEGRDDSYAKLTYPEGPHWPLR